ncbi:MAG TPA: SIS domain-containing protein, partial [Planctomycetota bacterium]|nr:SIS domain-containing protein [Planctomycetota bacterium]
MTELFQNIVNEPGELIKSLDFTCAPEREHLQDAAKLVKKSARVFITGIGSSWHAGMAITALMARYGTPPTLVDASELLHFTEFPANSVVIALSRSGKSVEIVQLLKKARASKTAIIGVTNTPDSPLAKQADVTLLMHAAFDRNVSITMYSALTLIGGLIAEAAYGKFSDALRKSLKKSLEATDKCLPAWTETIRKSAWCAAEPAYFLARGSALASCHEARLLWEEVAKFPASAMTTGGFRHGPQEILCEG